MTSPAPLPRSGSAPDLGGKVIISAAITGGATVPSQSPAIPVSPDAIVESAVKAAEAGAALVHIHVRDPVSGRPVCDTQLFREVLEGISELCDVVIQPTTGGGIGIPFDERIAVLPALRPEIATFNAGSMNFGVFRVGKRADGYQEWERAFLESTRDFVFRNTFAEMERICGMMRDAGTKPELEAYDVGHLYNIRYLCDEGLLDTPIQIQFVLGVLGGNAGTIDQLLHMRNTATQLFGDSYTWSVAGVGYPAEFHLLAAGAIMGGHIRVGLEDNLYIERRTQALSNAQLVEKAVTMVQLLDREPASASEARGFWNLKGREKVGFKST